MIIEAKHLTTEELEAGLADILQSPQDGGVLHLIVQRPAVDERTALEAGRLDVSEGLVGDSWKARGSSGSADGAANTAAQLTIMNARTIALIAQQPERWALAGDQLFVDMELSSANLPPGTRLAIGSAIVEVSSLPHNGCKKFVARFGLDAMMFVNSPEGKMLRLRGLNARVIQSGDIRTGDIVRKVVP